MAKIVFYDDSWDFGGHQMMAISIADVLSPNNEISYFYHNEKNGFLLNKKIIKNRIHWFTGKFLNRSFLALNPLLVLTLCIKIGRLKPDIIVVVQGGIESCLLGLIVGKIMGIYTVSYIPMCFDMSKIRAPMGYLRNIVNFLWYQLFDDFITISEEQQKLLKDRWKVKKGRICILPNTIDFDALDKCNCNSDLKHDGSDTVRLGAVGRIDFKQKRQQDLVEVSSKLNLRGFDHKFVIIGDGPELLKLKEITREENVDKNFEFCGWLNKEEIYNRFDILIFSSLFEGVPLVMLESLYLGKMVLAPRIGVFKEYLPDIFLYSSLTEIVEKIMKYKYLTRMYSSKYKDILKNKVQGLHSKQLFKGGVDNCFNSIISSQ